MREQPRDSKCRDVGSRCPIHQFPCRMVHRFRITSARCTAQGLCDLLVADRLKKLDRLRESLGMHALTKESAPQAEVRR